MAIRVDPNTTRGSNSLYGLKPLPPIFFNTTITIEERERETTGKTRTKKAKSMKEKTISNQHKPKSTTKKLKKLGYQPEQIALEILDLPKTQYASLQTIIYFQDFLFGAIYASWTQFGAIYASWTQFGAIYAAASTSYGLVLENGVAAASQDETDALSRDDINDFCSNGDYSNITLLYLLDMYTKCEQIEMGQQ